MGDIGVNATMEIIENLKEKVKENKIKEPGACKELLIETITEQMNLGENAYDFENQKSVLMVIGVNGVGKTTSIGKLAGQFKNEGKKVVLAAADTFRAAAADQLKMDIDKKKMVLPDPIKSLGVTEVPIKLHKDVTATLRVKVVEAK